MKTVNTLKPKIIATVFMSIITTGIVSFTLIGINFGFGSATWLVWIKSWAIAFVIVVPVVFLISPLTQRLANNLVKDNKHTVSDQ